MKIEYITFAGKWGKQAKATWLAAAVAMTFCLILPHFLSGPPGKVYHVIATVIPSCVLLWACYLIVMRWSGKLED